MSGADNVSSGKKAKDRIQQLSEIRRGLVHHTDAQYGTADDPLFVMHIDIDGMVSIVYRIVNCSLKLIFVLFFVFTVIYCLQCFDAVGWVAGRAPSL